MPAITVRNLPEEVHGALRGLAASRGLSAESLVRTILAEEVAGHQPVSGMAEAQMPWVGPQQGFAADATDLPELWGALRGSVHVAPGTDIMAPLGEAWDAQA